jgi:hypothetical protein
MTTTALLDSVFSPISRSLSLDVAQEIAEFRADEQTQQRVDELAEKNTEGTLTAAERDEYAEFVAAFNIITILQARARAVLNGAGGQ